MSKRTLALIIILVVITGVLVALAVTPEKKPVTPVIVPTPTSVAQTALAFSPNPLTIASASATVDVLVDTQTNPVTAVQLELSYDPKVITSIDVKPGSFFTNPAELLKTIDAKEGKISYALGILPSDVAKKGQGIVATISFRTNLKVGQPTQINFLPKTLVTASGITQSVLKSASNLTILFQNPPVSLPPAQQGTTSPQLP